MSILMWSLKDIKCQLSATNHMHPPKKFSNTSVGWVTSYEHLLESSHRNYYMYTL